MDIYGPTIPNYKEKYHKIKVFGLIVGQQAQYPLFFFQTCANLKGKGKVSPLQAMKAHGVCGCKGPHIHSHGTRMR